MALMNRKTFTLRLDPELYEALAALSGIAHRSMNDLAAEAVSKFVAETGELHARDLEKTAARLRSYTKFDPDFDKAIERLAEAEASHEDPLEGEPFDLEEASGRTVREILSNG